VGTIALFISFIRVILNHFTNKHHFGFESAIWYWHFIDVVWLFLFINVYWWSNSVLPTNNALTNDIVFPSSIGKMSVLSWLYNYSFLLVPSLIKADFFLITVSVISFTFLRYLKPA